MLKVIEATVQLTIRLKLKVLAVTVDEKFDEFTVRVNKLSPRLVGKTRRLRFTSIVVLDPPIDM